jgi:hypothetical protein
VGASLRECRELPAPLRAVLERPLAVSDWVSEVHLDGLIAAAIDAHFARIDPRITRYSIAWR